MRCPEIYKIIRMRPRLTNYMSQESTGLSSVSSTKLIIYSIISRHLGVYYHAYTTGAYHKQKARFELSVF